MTANPKTVGDLWSRWYGKILISVAAVMVPAVIGIVIALSIGTQATWQVTSQTALDCSPQGCTGEMVIDSDDRANRIDAAVDAIRDAYDDGKPGPVGYTVTSPGGQANDVTCSKRSVESITDTDSALTLCEIVDQQ